MSIYIPNLSSIPTYENIVIVDNEELNMDSTIGIDLFQSIFIVSKTMRLRDATRIIFNIVAMNFFCNL